MTRPDTRDPFGHWSSDSPHCGTCGRDCLDDGDCYGCEADRARIAECLALAGLQNIYRILTDQTCDPAVALALATAAARESVEDCARWKAQADALAWEANMWRGRAEALAEASNMWRAQAEALAGALANASYRLDAHEDINDNTDLRAAVARLPADALAERLVLEDPAEYVRDHHEHPDCDEGCLGCRYLAALDAVRGTP